MTGTTDVDGLMDSLTPEEFDRWAAWDRVCPLNHDKQMLSMIAMWLGSFLGQDMDGSLDDNGTTLLDILMPWATKQSAREQADRAVAMLKGRQ